MHGVSFDRARQRRELLKLERNNRLNVGQKATNSSTETAEEPKQENVWLPASRIIISENRGKRKNALRDLMAAVSRRGHEEGAPLTDSLVTMAIVASTVLYSMSSMSGGGAVLGNTCDEEA